MLSSVLFPKKSYMFIITLN